MPESADGGAHSGFRCSIFRHQARLGRKGSFLFCLSRRSLAQVAQGLRHLPTSQLVFRARVVVPSASGISSFGALMLLAPIVWILTIAIVICFAGKFWWFPAPISAHGEAYDQQFTITLAVTGVIFFAAQMALGYVIFRYRERGGRAQYSHGNNKLEALWTSAAAVLFVGLVLMGTRIWAGV